MESRLPPPAKMNTFAKKQIAMLKHTYITPRTIEFAVEPICTLASSNIGAETGSNMYYEDSEQEW